MFLLSDQTPPEVKNEKRPTGLIELDLEASNLVIPFFRNSRWLYQFWEFVNEFL